MKDIIRDILADTRFAEGVAWRRSIFHSGDSIVKKGEMGRSLFFVEAGKVRVLADAEVDGGRKISPGLSDLGEGSVFGDMCLFGQRKRTASVVAIDDVILIELDSERLSVYLDDHPILGYLFLKALFQVMAYRLQIANERVENLLVWGLKVHEIDKYL